MTLRITSRIVGNIVQGFLIKFYIYMVIEFPKEYDILINVVTRKLGYCCLKNYSSRITKMFPILP